MLLITIQGSEFWNEKTCEFEYSDSVILKLEHSLLSVSKWESKWKKPFLSDKYEKTEEMWLDYIRCMTINSVPDDIYKHLTTEHVKKIMSYINDTHTATTISTNPLGAPTKKRKKNQFVTSELIYYWMFSCQISKECEKWHLNRLMTLIQVFSVENAPPEKLSRQTQAARRSSLNASRLKKYHH